MQKNLPSFFFEKPLWRKKYLVVGIDEVGRGALAGPLTVAGVCFENKDKEKLANIGINDSKKLTPKKRNRLSAVIKKEALFYSIVHINVATIDKIGIAKSTQKAIRKVAKNIRRKTAKKIYLLLDAFHVKYVKGIGLKKQKAIIKGDGKSVSIAAASIIAKVARDNFMIKLAKKCPAFGFDKHKGYGTKTHQKALKKHGKTPVHRTLFIRNLLK